MSLIADYKGSAANALFNYQALDEDDDEDYDGLVVIFSYCSKFSATPVQFVFLRRGTAVASRLTIDKLVSHFCPKVSYYYSEVP